MHGIKNNTMKYNNNTMQCNLILILFDCVFPSFSVNLHDIFNLQNACLTLRFRKIWCHGICKRKRSTRLSEYLRTWWVERILCAYYLCSHLNPPFWILSFMKQVTSWMKRTWFCMSSISEGPVTVQFLSNVFSKAIATKVAAKIKFSLYHAIFSLTCLAKPLPASS